MTIRIAFFYLCWVLSVFSAQAQKNKIEPARKLDKASIEQLRLYEDTLAVLSYAVVNDSAEERRFASCRVLVQALVRALKVDNSFKYPFSRLSTMSIISPPDSSFRIFSWQLFVNDSTYRYYGAIQMNSRELVLHPLIDRSFEFDEPPLFDELNPDNWYGALYYNLRQFNTPEGKAYLLFGFDAYTFFEKRKLIEVLHFTSEGKPVFGAEVFDRGPNANISGEKRIFQEYSSETRCKLNWDEQYSMILFDHLIPMNSPFGRGVTMVTDGSYDGFKYEKGRWVFVDKVFNDVMNEEFRPEPILDARKTKDINGKGKRPRGKQ